MLIDKYKKSNMERCPFCGGQAELVHDDTHVYVSCKDCSCRTDNYKATVYYCAIEYAINAWNRRYEGIRLDDLYRN